MRVRKLLLIALSNTISPLPRVSAMVANAASISSGPRTSNDCGLIPTFCAAAVTSLKPWTSCAFLVSNKTATLVSVGTASLNNCTRLPMSSGA